MESRNKVDQLDTGKMLRKMQQQRRVTHAVLGRRAKRAQSTIKRLLAGRSVQCYVLWEMSVALRHNFFSDLAIQLDAATEGKLDQQRTELQQLQEDYQRLKEERDYMRKALDLLVK